MFTGIIQALGHIECISPKQGDLRLHIACKETDFFHDVVLGDSIATNGVCLTVSELPGNSFWADVSLETLNYSTLKELRANSPVNLEKALTPTSRLGGHIVSGHVDGVGQVTKRYDDARSVRLSIEAPAKLAKYIAHKGSICIDGMSLTVNAVQGSSFELNIVPHTMAQTICTHYRPGTRVNLEVDVIARYMERLMMGDQASNPDAEGISETFLAEHGFR